MKCIRHEELNNLCIKAGRLPRKRTNLNVHEQAADPVQRLFVSADRTSYFRPHRHPHTWEFSIVLKGGFEVLIFDDQGRLAHRIALGPRADTAALELPENTWHTWIPLEDGSLFFECKQGPYDPPATVEFAPWAPEEGAPAVAAFMDRLMDLKTGDCL
jgi:cupin fold WbuC family metalloprotein